ncbi:BH0509 family protein [Staphylococcus capitis]|uniref:BH0509 family protein n=1 Tax=Staphylococcus capitis TaxID=29388 RepID=UPI00382BC641
MSKLNLIALIDMMSGLKEDECISLEKMSYEKVEKYYINHYQKQDDEQIQISYF